MQGLHSTPRKTHAERLILSKPCEPNAVVKHGVEYIPLERKPECYRSLDPETRLPSIVPADKQAI